MKKKDFAKVAPAARFCFFGLGKILCNRVDVHIGNRIRQRRREIGYSREELAEMLGVSFQQIQRYEKGVSRVRANELFQIAHILDVQVGYFFRCLNDVDEDNTTKSGRLRRRHCREKSCHRWRPCCRRRD